MAPQKYKMRCHYDVLEVSRDASDGELKKAYRRLALEWHPDKNQHRMEEAEERFKEVRAAYETLSDPNERAWYDSHREAILRSGVHAAGGEDARPEDELNLMPFFTSAAFRGFGDEPGAFYAVYGDLFGQIDAHEQAASLAAGKDHFVNAPPFGASDAPWETVRKFYAHWGLFATLKTFAWADEYNLAEAANRKVRRLMEEENKKLRRAEAREYNDTVRQLIQFVRKRDKRCVKHQAEQAKLEKAKAAAAARKREAAKKARAAAASTYEEAEWAKQDAEGPKWMQDELEAAEAAAAAKEAAKQDLFCPVCKKRFKSQKQWENHEQSKQHKAAVLKLKEEMMADEELVRAAMAEEDDENTSDDDDAESNDDASTDERDGDAARVASRMRRLDVDDDASEGGSESDAESDADEDEDEDEDAALARMMGHARTKRPTPRANDDASESESDEDEDEDEDAALARLMGASRRVAVGGASSDADSDGGSTDDDSDLRSTTTNGDRAARNKPRKMLKKNRVGRKNARAAEPGAFGIIPELEEEGIDVGSGEDSDEETAATRRAAHFDVLDAEVVDDEGDGEGEDVVGEAHEDSDEDDEGPGGGGAAGGDEDGDSSAAAAAAAANNKGKKPRRAKKGKKGSGGGGDVDAGDKIRCSLCRLTFTSGNALHKHLKEAHSGAHKKKR